MTSSRTIEIFKELAKVPNCSKNTEKMRDFIYGFSKNYGDVQSDFSGNILVTIGKPKICLQAHYDMVCIDTDGSVKVVEDKDTIRADKSSLGADNGIAVAMMLSLIESKTVGEYLFTNDEEIGLIGANNLELEVVSKKILNLDEEREGIITVGCAGGFDAKLTKGFKKKKPSKESFYKVEISGLPGGHSGIEIHKGIPNALKELLLYVKGFAKSVAQLNAGERHNAIPRNAFIVIGVKEKFTPPESEHIKVVKIDTPETTYSKKIIDYLLAMPHGVLGWMDSYNIPSKSVNLAIIKLEKSELKATLSFRAMDNELLKNLKQEIKAFAKISKMNILLETAYSAWKPIESDFAKEVQSNYPESVIEVIHAGLEGAILKEKFPKADVVSIGPNIHHPHTNKEYVEVQSVKVIEDIVKKVMI